MIKLHAFRNWGIGRKIFFSMLLLSIFPLVVLAAYMLDQIRVTSRVALNESKQNLIINVVKLQEANLQNQAKNIDIELRRIQGQITLVAKQSENLYANQRFYRTLPPAEPMYREVEGFYWSRLQPDQTTVFLSSLGHLDRNTINDIRLSSFLAPLFKETVEKNHNLAAIYLVTTDNLTRMYPPLDFAGLIERKIMPADQDLPRYPFFYWGDPQHNPEKKVMWTDTYFDITDRGWMITSIAPIYLPGGEFKGIIGADITIEDLRKNIMTTRFNEPGAYAFLVNDRGKLIAVSTKGATDFGFDNPTDISSGNYKLTPLSSLISEILKKGKGQKTVNIGGESKILLFAPVPATGWRLGFVIPLKEISASADVLTNTKINRQINLLITRLLVTGLVMFLLAIVTSILMTRRITIPIYGLIKGAQKLGSGQLDHKIKVLANDEIGVLAETFNNMALRLKEHILDLQQKTKMQGELNEQLNDLNRTLEQKVVERTRELKLTNESLQQANERLSKLEESRRILIANVSHDLRTPLTAIQGYIEALRDGVATDEDTKSRYFDIIHKWTLNLARMVDDLLLLSKIQAGQKLNRQKVNCFLFFRQLGEMVAPEVMKAGLTFDLQISATLPELELDEQQIGRAFYNLIHNAIKFTPAGGEIIVEVNGMDDKLKFTVKDTGIGIPAEDLPLIFNRFFRGGQGKSRTGPGAGLGLAITKEIVEAHGGTIELITSSERGTIFSIQLPII